MAQPTSHAFDHTIYNEEMTRTPEFATRVHIIQRHLEAYPDVVLTCRVLACVACLGVVIIALTFTEPGFDDAGDSTVASANVLVLHSKPSQ